MSAMALSPDGKILASGGCGQVTAGACDQGEVRLWDVASGRIVGEPLAHEFTVESLEFSPDGKTLAAGDTLGRITLWDLPSSQQRGEHFRISGGTVNSLAFSSDGAFLVVGLGRHAIEV